MCFSSKDQPDDLGPKPSQIPQQSASSSSYPSKAKMNSDYAPPSDPPPSHSAGGPSSDYAPPAGPPPSKKANDEYAPPPGPPPLQDFAPPPGPPPAQEPKKHAWEEAVPDTSLLPPPPAFFSGFERSPANNATEEESEAGERWCREYPLYKPMQLDKKALDAMSVGNINLFTPPFFKGVLAQVGTGVWKGHSYDKATDTCVASYPPLYHVGTHSPLSTGRKKTIYYEVNILNDSRKEISLALGFVAPPYPSFRLPGWHRGSVGVHGDDGHKYINDRWGGKTFTKPFKRGETVGFGMDLSPGVNGGITVELFHTKGGHEVGRWNLHEESDREQDLPVTGLEGFHDLCASVGVFDKVSFEIVFAPGRWQWKGYQG